MQVLKVLKPNSTINSFIRLKLWRTRNHENHQFFKKCIYTQITLFYFLRLGFHGNKDPKSKIRTCQRDDQKCKIFTARHEMREVGTKSTEGKDLRPLEELFMMSKNRSGANNSGTSRKETKPQKEVLIRNI